MKRGTPRHPKMHALANSLGVPLYAAVGIMEMIWHEAGRYTPLGDVGSVPDRQIASWVDWSKNPAKLIGALVECGWFDRSEDYRLYIHDWPDHCERTVHKWVENNTKKFLPVYVKWEEKLRKKSGNNPPSREAMAEAEAEAFVLCSEEKKDVEILRPPPDVVSVLEELKEIYHRAGVPIAPRHEQLCLQMLIGLHPSKLWKVLDYVKWQLLKGHWRDSRTTKRLLNLLRDGDYDVELVERTLPKVSEKSSAEERHERFVAAVEQRIGTV